MWSKYCIERKASFTVKSREIYYLRDVTNISVNHDISKRQVELVKLARCNRAK
jgi:hypothetical protein